MRHLRLWCETRARDSPQRLLPSSSGRNGPAPSSGEQLQGRNPPKTPVAASWHLLRPCCCDHVEPSMGWGNLSSRFSLPPLAFPPAPAPLEGLLGYPKVALCPKAASLGSEVPWQPTTPSQSELGLGIKDLHVQCCCWQLVSGIVWVGPGGLGLPRQAGHRPQQLPGWAVLMQFPVCKHLIGLPSRGPLGRRNLPSAARAGQPLGRLLSTAGTAPGRALCFRGELM